MNDEWTKLCAEQGKDPALRTGTRTTADGRTVFIVVGPYGHHESLGSHSDALRAMIEAHRIGIEDLGSTRDLVWWVNTDLQAGEVITAIASELRERLPTLSGEKRDKLVLERIAELHQREAEILGIQVTASNSEALRLAHPDDWATNRKKLIAFLSPT